jgi:hypothetical protein
MSAFLGFLAAQRDGILVLLIALGVFGGLLNWLLWMFRWGRFLGSSPQTDTRLRFVLTEFFVKLIDDFRHLLALVIVLLFAWTLFLAMWPGVRKGNLNDVKDGVQAVAAVFGGLIGSIIGYYFGESAGSRRRQPPGLNEPPAPSGPAVQPDSSDGTVVTPPERPPIQGT